MKRMERGAGWLARRIAGPGTGRPAPLSAVRMALAVALPLLLGLAGGRLDLGSVGAIAALFTAIVEPGGGYRRHAQVYAVVTALNIVVVVLAVQVAHAALAAAVVMLALGILAGLASAWGEVPTMAAPAPLGLFILAQGLHPTPRLADAVLAVLIGSGWVMVLSVLPWPIAPFAPAELAVSDAWLSVAAFARDPTSTRLEMTAINAIEDGREVVAVIRSRRAGWSDRSHRLWAALVAAQRVTALISAVADDRRKEPADPPTRAAMDNMLAQVSLTAAAIATCTVIPRGRPDLTALHDAAATVHATVPSPDGLTGPPLHAALVAAGRARAAKRLLLRVREAVDALDLQKGRAEWIQSIQAALNSFDAALSPTVPVYGPTIESVAPGKERDEAFFAVNGLLLRNTSVVNMLDGCALSLPMHQAGELPSSMMVWQGPMHDDAVLNISLTIEDALRA
jgi:hypothetical protein